MSIFSRNGPRRFPGSWSSWVKILLAGVILINLIAFLHAWNFTHFTSAQFRTPPPEELTFGQRVKVLLTGVSLPRPVNFTVPDVPYSSHILSLGADSIALWDIPSLRNKGTIVMFHGYFADRTSLLEQAARFRRLQYRTVLVDFRGSGGSSGTSTSIGYHEMHEVKRVFSYIKETYDGPVILFGTSMGAAAILNAISKLDVHPDGVILECPFGTLYEAVVNRFNSMNIPEFPMAGLLVFWGGIQNGYWGFSHNPADYAKKVTCPALLYYGEKDPRVTMNETKSIYGNLRGKKVLVTFPEGGHGKFLENYENEWMKEAHDFLSQLPPAMVASTGP